MAYSSAYDGRPDVAARPFDPLRIFAAWIARARARRAQRVALNTLLECDVAMLDDLGITRADVLESLRRPRHEAGRTLTRRRAESARAWLTRS